MPDALNHKFCHSWQLAANITGLRQRYQAIFKRTRRLNWYGRVIFGLAVQFAMAHQQLVDTRKYWLGCVIAFDGLRRQRQNELARMHLQLAAAAKPESKEKTASDKSGPQSNTFSSCCFI